MILLKRVASGVRDHFEVRFSEWATTFTLFGLGVVFAFNPGTMSKGPSFVYLNQWADESVWSLIFITAASLRFMALLINGTFRQAFPWSPHIRGMTSLLATCIWGEIVLGMVLAYVYAGGGATGIVAYSTFFGMDVWNLFRSWVDVGRQSVYHGRH